MRPTVIANANASATAGPNGGSTTTNTNGINIPINHEYAGGTPPHHTQYADASSGAYGSPNSRQPQQQPHHANAHQGQQQTHPAQHFQQGFSFDPDMDMDLNMFPRTRLGRMHHDPFADFGTSRKRTNVQKPNSTMGTDDFSRYFDDAADFGFPQFGSLGRRRTTEHLDDDHDFFNRMPNEFRQYIPEGFATHRRGVPTQHQQYQQQQQQPPPPPPQQPQQPHQQYYQNYAQPDTTPPPNGMSQQTQSPAKKLCDAAIQTEDVLDGAGRSEVDCAAPADNLRQHGLRNTVDMGVKSASESEMHGPRAHSAPPPEQMQNQHQQPHQQQQMPANGKRQTPPPQQHQHQQHQQQQPQFGTQTSPSVQQQAPFQRAYFAPQQSAHPQQRQQTPPPAQPQTPGGTYVRTIPIFVEGRSEPVINHRDIPNQQSSAPNASGAQATASARAYAGPQQHQQQYHQPQQHHYQQPPQQHQQQQRPTPLNTQQQQQPQPQQSAQAGGASGIPPQTPHTLDSIAKIQDIQRDVLALMSKVEQFKGTRKDKEYAYLDEMLTRNLLKLDTIDTNGKDSIRLARKEAIKCIQASINVLEAKAEENAKAAAGEPAAGTVAAAANADAQAPSAAAEMKTTTQKSGSGNNVTKETADAAEADHTEAQPANSQQPIPLPPPESMQVDEQHGTDGTRREAGAAGTMERSPSSSSVADVTPSASTTTTTESK